MHQHLNHSNASSRSPIHGETAALLGRLETVRGGGVGWTAKCPAHPDRTPSLHLAEGQKGVLVHCLGGCPTATVLAILGVTFRDLFWAAR